MKRLMTYMSPNAFSIDTALAAQQLQQGTAAVGVLWLDSASKMDDPKVSKVVDNVGFAAAPAITPGRPGRLNRLVGRLRDPEERPGQTRTRPSRS